MSIKSILERAKLTNDLITIYFDSDDWGQYCVGYVDMVCGEHVRMQAVSRYGEPAGYEIRALSDIFKVETGGKYETKIAELVENRGKIFKEVIPVVAASESLIVEALQQSLKESVVVALVGHDPGEALVGFVEQLDSDIVGLRLIDQFGDDDGLSTMYINQITHVDFNTLSEQSRKFLYEKKNRT